MKEMTQPDNKFKYYAYVLCYVDNILCIHHDANSVLAQINGFLPLKLGSVNRPDIYLGAKLSQTILSNGLWAYAMLPSKYVKQAVSNCNKHLKDNYGGQFSLPKRAPNPFMMDYAPEMDQTDVLTPDLALYYQSLIGIMRWMIEIG